MLATKRCQSSGAENGCEDKNEPPPPPPPPPLLSLLSVSQCHSVPHFKLPLLGSGHRIVSAPLVRCGTLKSPLSYPISASCCLNLSLVWSSYLQLVLDLMCTALVILSSAFFCTSYTVPIHLLCLCEATHLPFVSLLSRRAHKISLV